MKHHAGRSPEWLRGDVVIRLMGSGVRPVRSLGVFAFALALGGCALLKPHIHEDALFETTYAQQPATSGKQANVNAANVQFAGDLANAIDDANRQRVGYLDATSQYSTVRNTAPLIATGLGAASLFMAITSGGISDTAAGLGLGSAGTIGLAVFYDNRPRQLVYISGADAIGCAIVAQRPLLMMQEDYDELRQEITELAAAIADLRAYTATHMTPWPVSPADPNYSPGAISKLDNWAIGILHGGRMLRRGIDSAGFALREKVISIVTAVDREIVKTDPDPKGIQQVIAGLGSSASGLLPATGPAQKKIEGGQQGGSLIADGLIARAERVRTLATSLSLRLDEAQALADVASKVETCNPEQALSTLRIVPDELGVVDVNAGTTKTYAILGGVGLPRVGVAGDFPQDSVKTKLDLASGVVQVTVEFTPDAVGNAQLIVADGSDLPPKTISFRIAPTTKKAAATPAPVVAAPIPLVVAPAPAVAPVRTRDAALLLIGPQDAEETELHETGLIVQVRCRLKLPKEPTDPNERFDAALRGAIYDFQVEAAKTNPAIKVGGQVDKATFEAVQSVGGPC
jgi:hypothetical protein